MKRQKDANIDAERYPLNTFNADDHLHGPQLYESRPD